MGQERDLVIPATMLRIPGRSAQTTQVGQHVGQGVEVAAVLDLVGDNVGSGQAGDGAPEVGRQEVVPGPLPTAHAGAAASCWTYWERGVRAWANLV
jgi:hypothetical protein